MIMIMIKTKMMVSGGFLTTGLFGGGLPDLKGRDLPRALDPPPAGRQSVVFRSSGHLGAFHFSIAFSMPLGIDLGSIFPPNLPPKIHQNPLKIDAKMPSHLDSIF